MSTKIYDGIRFKSRYLRQFQEAAYQHGLDDLISHTKLLLSNLRPEYIEQIRNEKANYLKSVLPGHEEHALRHLLFEGICEEYHKNHTDLSRGNPFSFFSGWNLYFRSAYCYAIPWGDNSVSRARRARELPFVEEYGYWNNSDLPENLSATQWDRRRRNWDAVLPDNWVVYRLSFEIVSFCDRFPRIYYDLEKAIEEM